MTRVAARREGFTILEVLIATMLLAILFLGVAPFFAARFSATRRIAENTLPPLIGRGIADAIYVGALENYDPVHNVLFFDYEGVRVELDLPRPFEAREYPGIVVRDTRDGLLSSSVDPLDVSNVPPGGFAVASGVLIRPGPNRVLDPGTVPAGDDRQFALGLYPLGPVLQVEPHALAVRPEGSRILRTVGLPIEERDVNQDGTFSRLENFNGSFILSRGARTRGQEVYEDTGPDRLRSFEEPGYDPVINPDPAGDDFHPVLNPSGPEGNGRLDRQEDVNKDQYLNVPDRHLDEDTNQDGLLNAGEVDLNGNGLASDRGVPIADRPPTANSQRPGAISVTPPTPAYPPPNDPVRSLGYAIIIQRPSDEEIYQFRILIYQDFLNVRDLLALSTPLRRFIVSHPEVGDEARNGIDDDFDGVIDDTAPILIDPARPRLGRTPKNPFADPELERNGVDDDRDGVIDDGLIEPIYIHTFVLRIGVSGVDAPGDPR